MESSVSVAGRRVLMGGRQVLVSPRMFWTSRIQGNSPAHQELLKKIYLVPKHLVLSHLVSKGPQ